MKASTNAQTIGLCSQKCARERWGTKAYSTIKAIELARRPDFYTTDEWRRARYDALEQHGNACQCCGIQARPGHPVHVDHIKPRYYHPELALDPDNLQILCDDCNLGKGARHETDWREAM